VGGRIVRTTEKSTTVVAPVDSSLDDRIGVLLDNIAESRLRLDERLLQGRDELERLQLNLRHLKETLDSTENFFELLALYDRSSRMLRPTNFTAHEIEVLRLLVQGFSTKQIADLLAINFKIAVRRKMCILKKMNCHKWASLVLIGAPELLA